MPKKTTVLFIWDVNKRLRDYLTKQLRPVSNVDLIFPSQPSNEEYVKLAPEADIIVGWRPAMNLLQAAEKLQLFIAPGAGVQHLIQPFRDLNQSKRVILANCHGNSSFVAQHAVALLLALSNKVVIHHNWMVDGKWRRGDGEAKSTPLRGRIVGLLGYGAINQKVHKLLLGFDLSFCILRREWKKHKTPLPTKVEKFSTGDLLPFLKKIDILIIAIPLTEVTHHLIAERELELLGSDGLIINVARGDVIDEADLFKALKNNIIAGAAIDTWYNYNPSADRKGRKYPFSHPFHKLQNVVLSPHRAASPLDDLVRWNEVIENIQRHAQENQELLNIVDLARGY